MADEILNQETDMADTGVETPEQILVNALNKSRENTVSMDLYQKSLETNKMLADALSNGGFIASEDTKPEPPKKSLDELRNELFRPKKELNNLEYVTKALELRDRVLEETGEDCFVASGHYVQPTAESYATAEKVAQVYRECIDYAKGNSELFTQELMRRTRETPILPNKRR